MGILDDAMKLSLVQRAVPTFRESLLSDESFADISVYMNDRYGMTENDYTKEEIVDSYTNGLRTFNSGNSVATVQELSYLSSATPEQREAAARAYTLWDNTPGVFSERGGTVADRADATFDYAYSLLLDPVNVVSLGMGKLAARGAGRAATALLVPSAKEAAEAVARSAAGTELRGLALEQAKREAFQTTIARGMQGASYRQATRRAATADVLGAAAADVVAGVGVDAAYQRSQVLAGTQSEYDPIEGLFSTLGGITGGGLSLTLNKLRGISGLPLASLQIERSLEIIARKEALSQQKAMVELDPVKTAAEIDTEKFKDLFKKLKTEYNTSWAERKAIGFDRLAREGKSQLFDSAMTQLFFMGDADEGIKGLAGILLESGLPTFSKRSKDDSYTNWMFDVLSAAGLEDEVVDLYDNTVGKFFISPVTLSFKSIAGVTSAELSNAGRSLGAAGNASQMRDRLDAKLKKNTVGTTVKGVTAKELMEAAMDEDAVAAGASGIVSRQKIVDKFSGLQNNLIRMLVTHPGTTYLNAVGWTQASTLQSVSDTLRGTLYGTTAGLNAIVGRNLTAAKYRNLAGQMYKLQIQKAKNLLDPYSTYEAVVDYLAFRPKARIDLLRYLSGGVEASEFQRIIGVAPDEIVTPNTIEKMLDKVQYAYGVQAVDLLTKTQEFMYSIDKQIRLKYGMSYIDFIKSEEAARALTETGTEAFMDFAKIEAVAVEDALRNVFSKPYGSDAGTLSKVAKIVEDARKYPVIGAMIPFGQFFNNTVATIADFTGISIIHKTVVGTPRDPMELWTRAAVGGGILAMFIASQRDKLEDGLAFNQERTRTGAVIDVQYDFPRSFFDFAGRMLVHAIDEGKVPEELFNQFLSTFGPESLSQGLDDTLETAKNMTYAALNFDTDTLGAGILDALKANSQLYITGFTRFADPFNQVAALVRGEEYVGIDRNQENSFVNKSFRYVDQFIEMIMGEPLAPQKFTATGGEQNRVPIGRIFGIRELPRQSSVQRLFVEIGRPDWMTEIRIDDPSVANRVNQIMFPVLEGYAEQLLSREDWIESSPEKKREAVRYILGLAKEDTFDILGASVRQGDDKTAIIFDIERSTQASREERQKIFDAFSVNEDELSELDLPQLQIVLHFIQDAGARRELLRSSLGIQ